MGMEKAMKPEMVMQPVKERAPAVPRRDAATYLVPLYQIVLALGIALMLAGSAVGLIRDGSLPTLVTGVWQTFTGVAQLDAAAILSLGVLVFLVTPATAIAFMAISYASARDRIHALISAGVVAIIVLSIVIAWLSGPSAAPGALTAVSIPTELGILLFTAVAGILGSMVGLGGGVFIVPVLSMFFGIPLKTAIATSAVAVIVNSLGGSSIYLKHRMTNVRLGLFLELTTAAGAIVGGLIVVLVAPSVLRVVLGFALLCMGLAMFRQQRQGEPVLGGPDRMQLAKRYHDPATGGEIDYVPQRLPVGVGAASFAGVISGMLGIGCGAVNVPIMNAIMRVPVKAAAATSMFMVGITISASVFIYYDHHIIDLSVTVPAVIGVLLGSRAGAMLSRHTRSVVLVRILVLILAYLAVSMLLKGFGVPIPGTAG